jgi:O-antigen/teichoic acid export membrane protein
VLGLAFKINIPVGRGEPETHKIMIGRIKGFIKEGRSSTLARNSGWMFLGYGLKIFVQAGYFILIARSLGPTQYGAFVGALALIGLVAPFSGMGFGSLLVKNVSREPGLFSEYWGNALLVSAVSGLILLGLVLGVARLALPSSIPLLLIVLISMSDLLAVKGTEIGAQGFQANDQLKYMAFLTLLPYIFRLIGAAIVFIVWRHATALLWGWFYLACTLISATIAVSLASYKLGAPKLGLWRIPPELKEGFYFGAGLSAQTVYNDIDKTMLASLSTLDATGIYAAAYRVIDVAFVPVRSVLYAAYSNFFRSGQRGIAASYAYSRKLMPRTMGYSVLAFVGLFLLAPLFPLVIGQEFARTVEALRWLALLPLLKTIHYFLSEAVTGAGYQGIRASAQIFIAVLNVGLNFWLIPAYSWRGAAWSSLACDGALAIMMYGILMFLMSKEARLSTALSEERI